jgi:hypothetical protein
VVLHEHRGPEPGIMARWSMTDRPAVRYPGCSPRSSIDGTSRRRLGKVNSRRRAAGPNRVCVKITLNTANQRHSHLKLQWPPVLRQSALIIQAKNRSRYRRSPRSSWPHAETTQRLSKFRCLAFRKLMARTGFCPVPSCISLERQSRRCPAIAADCSKRISPW